MFALLADATDNQTICLVLAIICFAIVAIIKFFTPPRDVPFTILALGLALFALAFLVISVSATTT